VNPHNPYMKLLAGMVAVTAAIRLSWELLHPVLVPLTVVVVLAIVGRLVWWRMNRF